MTETRPSVLHAGEVDELALDAFLRRFFPAHHADFLFHHGRWWHRGDRYRLAVVDGDTIAAYSAVIPAPCRIEGEAHPAHWLVNIIVDPAFRGRGLQRMMDERLKEMCELLLGFPNALAAKIHRKHGWGVREDHRTVLLPFAPTRLRPVLRASGWRGAALGLAARLAQPLAWWLRRQAARYRPATARQLTEPAVEALARIFERHQPKSILTSARDAEYLRWRYFDAPYRDELSFYVAGAEEDPSLAAIVRGRSTPRGRAVKLLDLFGDLEDHAAVADLLRLVARQATAEGAVEVMAFVTLPDLYPDFRAAGFVLRAVGRSCWLSPDPAVMARFATRPVHWCFGDSDNEEPA